MVDRTFLEQDIVARIQTLTEEIYHGNYNNCFLWYLSMSRNVLNGFYGPQVCSEVQRIVTDTVQKAEEVIVRYESASEETAHNIDSYANALIFIGLLLFDDSAYLKKDESKAVVLFDKAIALGNPFAMTSRAYMHIEGKGGPIDYAKAIELYEKAIVLSDDSAMTNRALMYVQGKGGPIDYVKAIVLLENAINLGNFYVAQSRNAIKNTYELNKEEACELLGLIWKNLLNERASLSEASVTVFQQHTQNEVFKKLTLSGYPAKKLFQLLAGPEHPIQRIFSTAPEYRVKLLKHSIQVQNERIIVIALSLSKFSLFKKLSLETIIHILEIAHGYPDFHEANTYESNTTPLPIEVISRSFSLSYDKKTKEHSTIKLLFMPNSAAENHLHNRTQPPNTPTEVQARFVM